MKMTFVGNDRNLNNEKLKAILRNRDLNSTSSKILAEELKR